MTLNLSLIAEASRVSAVDYPQRTITGLAAPYGEPGRTNLGPRALRASAVRFLNPDAPVVLGTYGHGDEHGTERGPVVARMTAYDNTPAGLRLTFRVAEGPLGDRLLAEADPASGIRAGMSIELDNCTTDPWTGDIVAADPLEYVAFVPIGAYASARVDLVARATTTGNGDDVTRRHASRFSREFVQVGGGGQPAPQPAPQQQQQQQQQQQPAPQQQPQQQQQPAPQQQQQQPALFAQAYPPHQSPGPVYVLPPAGYGYQVPQQYAPAPPAPVPAIIGAGGAAGGLETGSLPAGGQQQHQAPGVGPSAPAKPAKGSIRQLARLRAAMHRGDTAEANNLRAALVDITNNGANGTGLDMFQGLPGSYGQELWHGQIYQRRFVPLFTPKELITWKFGGWRWVTRPVMAPYTGDKTAVPSSEVKVEFVSGEAERLAGAWDIDRKFRDFGDPDFWQGFYEGQTESYAELSDQAAAAALASFATDLSVDANRPSPLQDPTAHPYAGMTYGNGVLPAVAFGDAILQDTPNVRRPADYVMMNTGDWLTLTQITNLDVPAFLSLLGVEPGGFLRSVLCPAGRLVMGVKPAASFYELGGGAPIRVEALDVANGGIDTGVFGYYGALLNRPGGVISVPINVAPTGP